MAEGSVEFHIRLAGEFLEAAEQLRLDAFETAADYTAERMALIAIAQVHATLATIPEPFPKITQF